MISHFPSCSSNVLSSRHQKTRPSRVAWHWVAATSALFSVALLASHCGASLCFSTDQSYRHPPDRHFPATPQNLGFSLLLRYQLSESTAAEHYAPHPGSINCGDEELYDFLGYWLHHLSTWLGFGLVFIKRQRQDFFSHIKKSIHKKIIPIQNQKTAFTTKLN